MSIATQLDSTQLSSGLKAGRRNATQLNSTRRLVQLRRYKRALRRAVESSSVELHFLASEEPWFFMYTVYSGQCGGQNRWLGGKRKSTHWSVINTIEPDTEIFLIENRNFAYPTRIRYQHFFNIRYRLSNAGGVGKNCDSRSKIMALYGERLPVAIVTTFRIRKIYSGAAIRPSKNSEDTIRAYPFGQNRHECDNTARQTDTYARPRPRLCIPSRVKNQTSPNIGLYLSYTI